MPNPNDVHVGVACVLMRVYIFSFMSDLGQNLTLGPLRGADLSAEISFATVPPSFSFLFGSYITLPNAPAPSYLTATIHIQPDAFTLSASLTPPDASTPAWPNAFGVHNFDIYELGFLAQLPLGFGNSHILITAFERSNTFFRFIFLIVACSFLVFTLICFSGIVLFIGLLVIFRYSWNISCVFKIVE